MVSDLIPLSAVPAYLMEKAEIKRSRMTVYNWVDKGVDINGQNWKLQIEYKAGQKFTKKAWVDTFLERLDQRRR